MIENVPFASTISSHAKQKPEYFSTAQKDLVLRIGYLTCKTAGRRMSQGFRLTMYISIN